MTLVRNPNHAELKIARNRICFHARLGIQSVEKREGRAKHVAVSLEKRVGRAKHVAVTLMLCFEQYEKGNSTK